MGLLYLDKYYFMLCVPAFIFALIAQAGVKRAYAKYSKIGNPRGLTGAEAARRVLAYYGITNVSIERVSGNLSDHYDPRTNVIRLSDGVHDSRSVAAIGIACHEAGHAAQYAEGYFPIKLRAKIIPLTNFGSSAGIILTILGVFFNFEPLISIGLLLYFFIVVFQLVTLPVEFNASRRAVKVADETGLVDSQDLPKVKKMLSAAAMTYVAALATAVAQFLRLFLRVNNSRNRR